MRNPFEPPANLEDMRTLDLPLEETAFGKWFRTEPTGGEIPRSENEQTIAPPRDLNSQESVKE